MKREVLIAGFGGQGVMMMGELLSYAAMLGGKHVTYMPSYGPEMRGGTANCSVIVSDGAISSPIVTAPDILIAMNEPSLDKFEGQVKPGGLLFVNSSMAGRGARRGDIRDCQVECARLARSIDNERIANIVMLGAMVSVSNIVAPDVMYMALERKFTGTKAKYISMNRQALTAWEKSRGGPQ
jgi:2-oxoglutarate ferredoxin oxidoreductase subunit gamma